jgi:uncharacterized membrane protein
MMRIHLITAMLGLIFNRSEVLLSSPPAYSQNLPQSNNTKLLTQAQSTITFFNRCRSTPLRLAIRFKNLSDQWETKAWYSLSPGEKARLNGVDTKNRFLYYYAEATDGSRRVWSGNDTSVTIGGKTYKMKKIDIGPNIINWTQSLTCTGETPVPSFPIRGTREDTVLPKRYMNTSVTISNNGRIDGITKTWSCHNLGFTGGVYVAVTDKNGNILNEPTQRKYGVNGRSFPGGRCSERTDTWHEYIPENKINDVYSVAIGHAHTPKSRITQEDVMELIRIGAEVYKASQTGQ